MKRMSILFVAALLCVCATCQSQPQPGNPPGGDPDSIKVVHNGDTLMIPGVKILHLSLHKAIRQEVAMGMDFVYVPETDVVGGNAKKSLSAVIIYQLPLGAAVTQVQLDSMSKVIRGIVEPGPVLEAVVTSIDNKVDAKFNGAVANAYVGTWTHIVNAGWNALHYDKSASFTTEANAAFSLTVSFTGTKVVWWTEKRINHGIAMVSIDGGAETAVDLYNARTTNTSEIAYTSPVLTQGPHKLKIRGTGTKNAKATQMNIIHDRVEVTEMKPK